MKDNFLKTTVLVMFFFASLSVFGNTLNSSGTNAEITPVDNLFLGKNVEKIWTINYSNGEKPVTVTRLKTQKYPAYVVRSQFFEVVYASDEEGFGVKKVTSSQRSINKKITDAVLNSDQLHKQGVLTPNEVSEEYALGLIASYLPDLLNNGYKHLIY